MTAGDQTAALHAALARAVARAAAVEKDGANTYHRYRYASAEAMLTEARAALAAEGLALVISGAVVDEAARPLTEVRAKGERASPDDRCPVLVVDAALVHAEGGSLPLGWEWPVVVEAGRPADKAVASARTTSLAYALRDLLLLPRVDESDDMDSPRRDEARERAEREAREAAARDAADVRRLRSACLSHMRAAGITPDEMPATVRDACGGREPRTIEDWRAVEAALDSLAAAAAAAKGGA